MKKDIKQFVFTGLLLKHTVRDLQANGLLRRPDADDSQNRESDLFIPVQEIIRNSSLQMQYCYRLLFVLENSVRQLIISRLSESDGPNWFDKRATATMKKKVEQRLKDEQKNQWHTGRNRDPIYLLDFGDLARLITNHWDAFEDLLPNQAWVQSRLEEAERTRNVIAHTNLLSSQEVSRLEMYLRDWIMQIG